MDGYVEYLWSDLVWGMVGMKLNGRANVKEA